LLFSLFYWKEEKKREGWKGDPMEFTISRDELQSALYLMQGVVERRTPIPILGNVLLTAEGDAVIIAATDQQIGVRRKCIVRVKRKGSTTANGRMLHDIVRELPEGEVLLRSLENHWIEIASGKSRFKVVGIDPQEFPAMPRIAREERQVVALPAATLSEMIVRTLFAVSVDETRVNLSGIFLDRSEAGLVRMVATDGHRLAMISRKIEGVTQSNGVILPRKGIVELRRLLEGGDEPVSLATKPPVVHATRGPVELSMRLVEGEFPDYRQVIPTASTRHVGVSLEALEGALRRVSLVSSEISHGIRLAADAGVLRVSSVNPDRGEAEEEIEAEFEGAPLTVGFNARYLLDVLNIMPPGSRVEMSLGDELSPGIIKSEGDADFLYVVMPMRL
jgi:DNA polymerase-3 subunit beta